MNDHGSRGRPLFWVRTAGHLLLLVTSLCLSGCNAGLIGLAVWLALDDDDGGGGGGTPEPGVAVEVELREVDGARTDPSSARISFVLMSDVETVSEVRFEVSDDGNTFRPATVAPLASPSTAGESSGAGGIRGLVSTPSGVAHRVGWNALEDAGGGTGQAKLTLRLTTISDNTDQTDVFVGNEAPSVRDLAIQQPGEGEVILTFTLVDSASDPVNVGIEHTTSSASPEEAPFEPGTVTGTTEGLATSPAGTVHTVTWRAVEDLGRVDRTVQLRLTVADVVEGEAGLEGTPLVRSVAVDGNAAARALLLTEELAADPDTRRGIAVRYLLEDADSDPVDVIIQWSAGEIEFPELPAELDTSPTARAALMRSADERRAYRIITPRPEVLEGPVEDPAAGPGEADTVLATWIGVELELRGLRGAAASRGPSPTPASLLGTRVEVVRDGTVVGTGLVCDWDPATGILRTATPLDPAPGPGDRLRLRLDSELRLATAPTGRAHQVIWDSGVDVPGGGPVHLKVTPFERIANVAGSGDLPCRGAGSFPRENAILAARGDAAVNGQPKELSGPFALGGPVELPLAPFDIPGAVAVGNVDGEGGMDIVTAVRGVAAVIVHYQNAAGFFDAVRFADARMGEPRDLALADVDADGDLDIVVLSDDTGRLLVMHQEPGGDFITRRELIDVPDLEQPARLAALDLDGDGDVDLAIADASTSSPAIVLLYRGDAPAGSTCSAPTGEYTPCVVGASEAGRDLLVADVDGDSSADLVTCDASAITVSYGDGSGRFDERRVRNEGVATDLRAVGVADADLDGTVDLFGLDRASRSVVRLLQRSADVFEPGTPLEVPSLEQPVAMRVGDFSGTGGHDVIIVDPSDSSRPASAGVTVCSTNASGEYSCDLLAREAGDGGLRPAPRAVALADVDGSGGIDLVVGEDGTHAVAVHYREGPGDFSAPAELLADADALDAPSSLAVADLDGDGRLDVATTSVAAGTITTAYRRAGGETDVRSFSAPAGSDARGPLGIAAGDVDGDGRADLATANVDSGNVTVFLQSASGTFDTEVVTLTKEGLEAPGTVALADLDGDGRTDVVTAGYLSNDVVVFRQLEGGGFSAPTTLAVDAGAGVVLERPSCVVATDLDGDGRVDVAVCGLGSDNVVIFWQESDRTISPGVSVDLEDGASPLELVACDLDGDGDRDLAVVGIGAPPVALVRQTAARSFSVSPVTAGLEGATTLSIGVADFDLDGRMDLAVTDADQFDPMVRILLTGESGLPGSAGIRELRADALEAPAAIAVPDLDGDGEPDVVTANRAADTLTVVPGGR